MSASANYTIMSPSSFCILPHLALHAACLLCAAAELISHRQVPVELTVETADPNDEKFAKEGRPALTGDDLIAAPGLVIPPGISFSTHTQNQHVALAWHPFTSLHKPLGAADRTCSELDPRRRMHAVLRHCDAWRICAASALCMLAVCLRTLQSARAHCNACMAPSECAPHSPRLRLRTDTASARLCRVCP